MRYKLTLAYNGENYHGWQTQPNAPTVQETLERAFSVVLRQNISITGCGRTDTGVHAEYYVAHFDTYDINGKIGDLIHKMNSFLPKDIAIYNIEPVGDDFNARFSAVKRSYRYWIHTRKDPFLDRSSWLVPYPIDIEKMNQGCEILKRYTDFASFCKAGSDNKTTICHISSAQWTQDAHRIKFEISADRFLRNMVRAIVGTMVDLGLGKTSLADFEDIIKSHKRSSAGQSVPAKGLALVDIRY
ncbi:MAG: tRNA pseudouridine(38-40) synthase TruA [Bacteroidales bacterium]|nr:tRNA pseudouridine(38-40) synthase TruA [Bacteroidales bacterium]